MISHLADLAPATRVAADAWLAAATASMDADLAGALRDELVTALCEGLDADSTPDDVAAVADRIGPLAAGPESRAEDPRVGSFAGIPYDWRRPTCARICANLWDPTSDRLWKPRAFGVGWDLNFGALAVRLGLIEPDAEDDPFTHTPDAAFALAAALPVGLAGAVALHYAVRGARLPDRLPLRWTMAGRADRWTDKRRAAARDLALAVVAAAASAGVAGSHAPRPARAATQAATVMVAALAATVTVRRSLPDRPRWWAGPLSAAGAFGAAGATLVGLALAGRDVERRRDLGGGA